MSRYGRESGASDCKLYVGDLGSNASKQELEESFSYYGPLRNVWVARNPPGFAFVEFEEPRDAEDAVRGLDGRTICGRRARVEMSTGMSKSHSRGPPSRRGGGGGGGGGGGRAFHPEDRCYECGERGHYARDCSRYSRRAGGSGGRRGGRSDSRSRSRSRDRRSRSRSASRSRSKSRSRSRSARRSPVRGAPSRNTKSRSRSRSKSRSR